MISNNYLVSPRAVEDAVGVTLASWSDQTPVAAIKPDTSRSAQTAEEACGTDWVKAC